MPRRCPGATFAGADAKRVKLEADATAERTRLLGQAEADATTVRGEAEGTATKAKGLADFALRHGDLFGRLELIIKEKGKLIALDVNKADVRDKVAGLFIKPIGTGPERKIGDLGEDQSWRTALSPNGRDLAVVRGRSSTDVVLIKAK